MTPKGCNEEGAISYMGCTRYVFKALRQSGVARAVRRGWYLYCDLDAALEALRTSKTPNRAGGLTPREFTR